MNEWGMFQAITKSGQKANHFHFREGAHQTRRLFRSMTTFTILPEFWLWSCMKSHTGVRSLVHFQWFFILFCAKKNNNSEALWCDTKLVAGPTFFRGQMFAISGFCFNLGSTFAFLHETSHEWGIWSYAFQEYHHHECRGDGHLRICQIPCLAPPGFVAFKHWPIQNLALAPHTPNMARALDITAQIS